jgi:hypothetical protein
MKKVKIIIAALLIAISLIALAYSLLHYAIVIKNHATIKTLGVGVYWDQACTLKATEISWGLLEPGTSKNVSLYVANEGNTFGYLSMNTTNWQPVNASDFILLTWTAEGEGLDVGQVIYVTFTIEVLASISRIHDFSFDILVWISG